MNKWFSQLYSVSSHLNFLNTWKGGYSIWNKFRHSWEDTSMFCIQKYFPRGYFSTKQEKEDVCIKCFIQKCDFFFSEEPPLGHQHFHSLVTNFKGATCSWHCEGTSLLKIDDPNQDKLLFRIPAYLAELVATKAVLWLKLCTIDFFPPFIKF